MESNSVALILSDIRSMENVGSIFRTADAVGISKIYLCGITPAPVDRFGRPALALIKAALGAEKTVSWEKREDALSVVRELREKRYQIIAIEQSGNARDYKDVAIHHPVAFILGSEVDGLPPEVLQEADIIAEIPMKGSKESLNVAVAAGVALYRYLDR